MAYSSIREIQGEALTLLDEQWQAGASEVIASIPHYAAPWEVAANDAESFLIANPDSHALFVYPHEPVAKAFAAYLGAVIGSDVAFSSPEKVAESNTSRHFDYVAVPEASVDVIRHRLAPRFLLRLTTEPISPADQTLQIPSYQEAGGAALPWGKADSLRLYRELFFDKGGVVRRDEIIGRAKAGQAPHMKRFLEGYVNLQHLRDEAGLPMAAYSRGWPLPKRAEYLRHLERELGGVPTVGDIKAAAGAGRPSYETLIKGTDLTSLRKMAGQHRGSRITKRREALGMWTAKDSVELYRQLAEQNEGNPPTRREVVKALSSLEGERRPTIDDFLKPFKDKGKPREAFGYLQLAAGFTPSRNLAGTSKKKRHVIDIPPDTDDDNEA